MKDKVNRLEAIKSIVSANRVSGQEELLQRLREQGFDLTQATSISYTHLTLPTKHEV